MLMHLLTSDFKTANEDSAWRDLKIQIRVLSDDYERMVAALREGSEPMAKVFSILLLVDTTLVWLILGF